MDTADIDIDLVRDFVHPVYALRKGGAQVVGDDEDGNPM